LIRLLDRAHILEEFMEAIFLGVAMGSILGEEEVLSERLE